jgi:glycogen synthase
MKIALVSYEYPPDTAVGGIGTYVQQIAQVLHHRGHPVTVFAGSPSRSGRTIEAGIEVHRVQAARSEFAHAIAPIFAQQHQITPFDVMEGGECGADARVIQQEHPDLPLIIKLHTPSFLIDEINAVQPTWEMHLRRYLGALRRGQWPTPFPQREYNPTRDIERLHTLTADLITTPSHSLGQCLIKRWDLPSDRIRFLPNPYIPSAQFLQIPVETQTKTVTFLGRLEIRKGVMDFAQAIPHILQRHPDTRFRFVGQSLPSPRHGLDMQTYLQQILKSHGRSIEFTGAIPLNGIAEILSATDVCVFPSLWENFPNVCLEAMAAARGVVGSTAGGMVEQLDNGRCGRLVPPKQPAAIAAAVIELLDQPALRRQLGAAARRRVLACYNQQAIGHQQEAVYAEAIVRHQKRILNPISI